jgi:hypothetical protein
MPGPDPTEELKQKEAQLKAEAEVLKAETELTKAKADAAAAAKAADPAVVAQTEERAREEARIKAETVRLRTQSELLKAQEEYAAAAKPPDLAVVASIADKARLDAHKAALDAAKGVSDAKKATDLAAAQTAIGTLTGSSIEGTVTVKADAGKGEATLLAALGVIRAADKLVKAITYAVNDKHIVVMQGAESSQFGTYRQFLLQQGALEKAFEYAHKEADRLSLEGGNLEGSVLESVPILTTAGVALDAAAKLGSYFLSNYEIGGVGLTPDTDQLVGAVIDRLLQKAASVEFPARRVPQPSEFSELIKTLTDLTTDAETKATDLSKRSQRTKDAAVKKDATNKENLLAAAVNYEQAAILLRKAISKAEEFISGVTVADSKGVLVITKIAQEKALCDALNAGALALYLDVRAVAGGYYTKKNLWTFLGAMPFYVMGGIVVTYYLVDQNGMLKASGLIPVHSGYSRVSDVPGLIN